MLGQVSGLVLIISVIVSLIVAACASGFITYFVYKNKIKKQIGDAEEKAREILDKAFEAAEA